MVLDNGVAEQASLARILARFCRNQIMVPSSMVAKLVSMILVSSAQILASASILPASASSLLASMSTLLA
jgi:hypothetical protein